MRIFAIGLFVASTAFAQVPPPGGGGIVSELEANGVIVCSVTNDGTNSILTCDGDTGQTLSQFIITEDGGDVWQFRLDGNTAFSNLVGGGVFRWQLGGGNLLQLSSTTHISYRDLRGNSSGQPQVGFQTVATPTALAYSIFGDLNTGLSVDGDDVVVLVAGGSVPLKAESVKVTIDTVLALACVSSAPTGGAKGHEYCDSDLTVKCWHNGTNFVQMDDFSTVCN